MGMASDEAYGHHTDGANDAASTVELPDEFFTELEAVCVALGCESADMLAVMMSESGVRPAAQHHSTKATGLIQLMPKTLQGLGWTAGPDAFARLSAVEQLPYVKAFYQPLVAHGLDSSGRLYQATFLPATLGHGSDPETVVCAKDGPFADAYTSNVGLDVNSDGAITVGDLTARTNMQRTGGRWKSLAARLR